MALPTSLKELKNAIAEGHALLATSTISMAIERNRTDMERRTLRVTTTDCCPMVISTTTIKNAKGHAL